MEASYLSFHELVDQMVETLQRLGLRYQLSLLLGLQAEKKGRLVKCLN